MSKNIRSATREQIEQRAYELYLARGCEPGKELDDWLAAETELMLEIEVPKQSSPLLATPKVKAASQAAVPPA